jgi:uncharacterized protein
MRGKTAVVTGASSGIGAELAGLCAADGCDVVLVARRKDRMEALRPALLAAGAGRVDVVAADLAADDGVDRLLEALRDARVDVLVNNAGYGLHGRFATMDAARIDEMLRLNVVALTRLTRALLPGMIERGFGRVLHVASTAAFQPGPLMAAYYASKAYVLSFSEAVHEELRGTGVTSTCLCPGFTQTEFAVVAGITAPTKLATMHIMQAKDVARAGYRGMQRGQRLVVPGAVNKATALLGQLGPRFLVPKVVRMLQDFRQ